MVDLKNISYDRNYMKHKAAKFTHILFVIFRTLFFIGMIYVLLYPLISMLSRSFRSAEDMYNPAIVWIPQHFTLDNFKEAWKLLDYGQTALKTGRISIISTILTMASCSMAGYALGRFDFKINKIAFAITVLTVIVPIQTYIIPLYFKFRFFDFFGIGSLINLIVGKDIIAVNLSVTEFSYYIMSAFGMGIRSGLFILVFYQFFKTMPKELDDASRIDGCGEFGTFARVMLPNALPPYLVTFILSTVWYWNDTTYGSVLLRRDPLLVAKISNIRNLLKIVDAGGFNAAGNIGQSVVIFAAALLFIMPPLIMYLIAQRFFMQSIERSGIVG